MRKEAEYTYSLLAKNPPAILNDFSAIYKRQ